MNFIQFLTLTNIRDFFTKGHERSVKVKKNIAASFVIKGLNIAIGLALVPLTINYLNPTKYGIWITLSSIIGWFAFFDIGLGNGLRNKFAEALALGRYELAKTYVSTTYAILSIIIVVVLILFYAVNPYLNWASILNAGDDPALQNELSLLALIVFSFFCLRFVFQILATILIADQQPAKASLLNLYSNALSLLFIIILIKTTSGSLVYIGIIFSSLPVIVFLISGFWFFNKKYKFYRPSIKSIDFSKAKDLFSLGIKFFIIEIAGVLIFQTNNIIIAQVLSPAEVTPYYVAFRYFSVLMMLFAIVVSPFWSAFTEAWVKREISWIKKTMSMLFKFWGILFFLGLVMLLLSPVIYKVWIGEKVVIPFTLSAMVCFWTLLNVWNGIFSHLLNGLGKINIQLILGISSAIINVPLAIYFGMKVGILGILFSNILVVTLPVFIYPIQYKKLIGGQAIGIWNR